MSFVAGLPMALATMGAGAMSMYSTAKANTQNMALAQRQMDFQRMMSSTAYQRAVQDMRKAGINPILAYGQGGASTPSGATTQVQPELGAGAQSALAVARAQADVQNVRAQTELLRAQAEMARFKTLLPALVNSALSVTAQSPSGSLLNILNWVFKTIGEGLNKE